MTNDAPQFCQWIDGCDRLPTMTVVTIARRPKGNLTITRHYCTEHGKPLIPHLTDPVVTKYKPT